MIALLSTGSGVAQGNTLASSNPVAVFRQQTKHRSRRVAPLSLRERLVLFCLAIEIIFAAWAFGGMRLIPLYGMGVLSVLGFGVLWLPLPRFSGLHRTANDPAKVVLKRLLRFPVFWLGLALMGYIAVQAWNTSETYVRVANFFFLEPIPYVAWLPSSVAAPIEEMNAWRMLILLGTSWLAMCTLWVGLQRRRAILILLWVMAINTVMVAGVALLQNMSGQLWIPYLLDRPAQRIWGPFLYTNHAAAWLNLGLVVILALLLHYHQRQRGVESDPKLIFMLMAVIVLASVVLSYSRAGILAAGGICLIFLGLLIGITLRRERVLSPFLPAVLIAVMMVGLGALLYGQVNQAFLRRDFAGLQKAWIDRENDVRYQLNYATRAMIQAKPLWGWGAGSFRYAFPAYQRENPVLGKTWRNGKPLFFEYAHNDWLQYWVELGWAGGSLLLLILLYWLGLWLLLLPHWTWSQVMIGLGCLVTLMHAGVDFVFYNPAIFLTFSLLICGISRCLKSQAGNNRRLTTPLP